VSYSKFKIVKTGEHFYYNNKFNALYDQEGNDLSLPSTMDLDVLLDLRKNNAVTFKTNKPRALRITLGHGCNYDCSYCMQKDIGNPNERPKNENLDTLIDQIRNNLDLSELIRIELWGGEPFLYWNDMVQLMLELDGEGRHFYISTNASGLAQKHVDFFKSLTSVVTMGISHDGPMQELLRGKNPLEKKADIIKQLDDMHPKFQFSFNPVVSKHNYNLYKINDYFKAYCDRHGIKNASISWTLGRIHDETNSQNSADHVISGDHIPKFKKILEDYLVDCEKQLKEFGREKGLRLMDSAWFNGPLGVLKVAASVHTQTPIVVTSSCGADSSEILSFDLNGKVRLCPHTSEDYIAGEISNIKAIKIIKIDTERSKNHCEHCPNLRLCKSSCPIKVDDEVFKINCRVEKTLYGTIQRQAFSLLFESPIELIDWGLSTIPELVEHA
jgi:uncharacterized protein